MRAKSCAPLAGHQALQPLGAPRNTPGAHTTLRWPPNIGTSSYFGLVFVCWRWKSFWGWYRTLGDGSTYSARPRKHLGVQRRIGNPLDDCCISTHIWMAIRYCRPSETQPLALHFFRLLSLLVQPTHMLRSCPPQISRWFVHCWLSVKLDVRSINLRLLVHGHEV